MPEVPQSQERQVARAQAEERALRPTWGEAAGLGAALGAVAGLLMLVDPVLPLGATETPTGVSVQTTVRAMLTGALVMASLASIGAFLIRLVRKRIVAARFRTPVA